MQKNFINFIKTYIIYIYMKIQESLKSGILIAYINNKMKK